MQLRACVSPPLTCLRTPGHPSAGGRENTARTWWNREEEEEETGVRGGRRRNTGDEQMQTRQFTATRREQSHVVPPTCVNSKEKGGCWEDGGGGRKIQESQRKVCVVVGGKTEPCCDWLSMLRAKRRSNLKLSSQGHSQEGKGQQTRPRGPSQIHCIYLSFLRGRGKACSEKK